jgi:release factor glutamine methyltransferase
MESTASPMSIGAALNQGRARLSSLPSARLDAELLLAHVLRCPRSALLRDAEHQLSTSILGPYWTLIARRSQGEPLAYVTGEREFWSLPLRVTPAVLVPRPETELVVERALALLDAAPASIADLGTGCGAIALALARERPNWQITATDQSAAALAVATQNARDLQVELVRFLQSDWFAALGEAQFDLIVSNPPYIAAGDPALADAALQHEPQEALVSGPSGLDALRQIINEARSHLRPGGYLILEHGSDQAFAVGSALVNAGYAAVRSHRDLAGHERVTEARAAGLKNIDNQHPPG